MVLATNKLSESTDLEEEKVGYTVENSSSLDFSDTLADYGTWKDYHKENIELTTDFIAIDTDGNEISKKDFLERLKTGHYIPIKLFEADYMYQLYDINDDADVKISKHIKLSSDSIYSYFLKEGEPFPEFDFQDINGGSYTSQNTEGNILVIECWYLQCTQCVEEFPKINDLYDRYESHDSVIFLAIVFDEAEKISKFLSKKEYRYPVIPNQKDFTKNELGLTQYPTHLIVDQYGNIKKMVNNIDSLTLALDAIVDEELSDNTLQ